MLADSTPKMILMDNVREPSKEELAQADVQATIEAQRHAQGWEQGQRQARSQGESKEEADDSREQECNEVGPVTAILDNLAQQRQLLLEEATRVWADTQGVWAEAKRDWAMGASGENDESDGIDEDGEVDKAEERAILEPTQSVSDELC